MKKVVIFVPGIMQFPYVSKNWDGRAATWMNFCPSVELTDRTDYFCTPIGRAFFQQKRVDRVKNTIVQYLVGRRFDVSLCAHSNGTDLVLRCLKELGWPRVKALHLFSGACEADFNINGLNVALSDGKVGKVFIYVAGKDKALKLASTWIGWLLGYGTLGLKGPKNVLASVANKVSVITEPNYNHSDWFDQNNFDQTMKDCLLT